MSEAMKPANPAAAVKPMHVLVQGRVEAVRRYQSSNYTLVKIPAPDEYSNPSTVEVRSSQRFAEVGEGVKVLCVLSGYAKKPRQITDRTTGEIRSFVEVNHYLSLVE